MYQEATSDGDKHFVLTYGYDANGRTTSVVGVLDGVTTVNVAYGWDNDGRMTSITDNLGDKRVGFTYNALGQYTTVTRYSDAAGTELVAQSTYGYDDANRRTSLVHALGESGATSLAYALQYDVNSQITQLTTPDGVNDYTLDNTGQLTDAGLTDESYGYDANGNRTSGGTVTGADNRISEDASYTYTYDDEGNLLTRTAKDGSGSQTFAWDYRNRLSSVTTRDGVGVVTLTASYEYDAFDRRIRRTLTGPSTLEEQYLYEGTSDADVSLVLDGSGAVILRQLNAPGQDQVLAEDRIGQTTTARWTLTDHEGSVRDVIDDTGAVADHIVYDSFGNILSQTNASELSRATYTGAPTDGETGFVYLHHRYFDPSTGRFLSADPMSFGAGDTNLYRYVGNGPVNATDPSGLCKDGGSGGWWDGFTDWVMNNNAKPGDRDWTDTMHDKLMAFGENSREAMLAPAKALDFTARMIASEGDDLAANGNVTAATLANADARLISLFGGAAHLAGEGDRVGAAFIDQLEEAQRVAAANTGSDALGVVGAAAYGVGAVTGTNQILEGLTGQEILSGDQIQGGWMVRAGMGAGGLSQLSFLGAGVAEDGDAAPVAAEDAGSTPMPGVRPYEVDTWENLNGRQRPFDGLQLDHQPSHASNVAGLERELGRPLTPQEIKQVYNQGTAVAVPDAVHRASPTWGPRNTPQLIAQDGADAISAAARDSEAMIRNSDAAAREAARAAADEIMYRARNGFGR